MRPTFVSALLLLLLCLSAAARGQEPRRAIDERETARRVEETLDERVKELRAEGWRLLDPAAAEKKAEWMRDIYIERLGAISTAHFEKVALTFARDAAGPQPTVGYAHVIHHAYDTRTCVTTLSRAVSRKFARPTWRSHHQDRFGGIGSYLTFAVFDGRRQWSGQYPYEFGMVPEDNGGDFRMGHGYYNALQPHAVVFVERGLDASADGSDLRRVGLHAEHPFKTIGLSTGSARTILPSLALERGDDDPSTRAALLMLGESEILLLRVFAKDDELAITEHAFDATTALPIRVHITHPTKPWADKRLSWEYAEVTDFAGRPLVLPTRYEFVVNPDLAEIASTAIENNVRAAPPASRGSLEIYRYHRINDPADAREDLYTLPALAHELGLRLSERLEATPEELARQPIPPEEGYIGSNTPVYFGVRNVIVGPPRNDMSLHARLDRQNRALIDALQLPVAEEDVIIYAELMGDAPPAP